MSLTVGELDSELSVEGAAAGDSAPAAEPVSAWAEQERHDAASRRHRELCSRTAAGGFHD